MERAHLTVDGYHFSRTDGEVFSPYGLRVDVEGRCVEAFTEKDRVRMCVPPPKA